METPRAAFVIFALVSLLDLTYAVKFEWASLPSSMCVANYSLCVKPVEVECVAFMKGISGSPVPEHYCRKSSVFPKPSTLVPCDVKECHQRCIVSMWSSWNPCDPACVLSFKYRTRRVLWSNGTSAVCPPLIERSPCAQCSKSSQKGGNLFWKVGQWGSCRQFTTITVHQSPVQTRVHAPSPKFCAAVLRVGKSTRKVRCVDGRGVEGKMRKCLNSKDKYGRITQRPEKTKVCPLPCDCHVSNWSQWSGCTKDCHVTQEKRTRDVLYAAQLGGKPCGVLEEKRACATQKICQRYEWYAASWGLCQTQRFPGNSIMSKCGHGFQERSVFCIKSGSNKNISELQPVQGDQCDPSMKLISRKPCHTPCPQDCKVSEWQSWEPCPNGCGQGGIKKKRRTVLQKASHGGRDCPNLVELSPCERVPCYSWVATRWSMCFLNKCGRGVRYRHVYCLGHLGGWSNSKYCKHLVKHHTNESCSKPCSEDCAVSHWSEWGPCSKSCGIQGGIQMRYKRILGYPSASGAPCPANDKLVESRKCNSRTFCEKEMNFMWKADPWGTCEPLVKGICGIFKGVKKRTVHCVTHTQKLGNTGISFCPQQLKPTDVNPCDVPCPKNCIVSKWQEWSVCSEMCRSTGVEMRERFILQEPSQNGTACPSNMTDGVEMEVRPCTMVPSCYTYRSVVSEWKKCTLLPQTKSKCGAGYQTRNISCLRSDQTLVEASFCYKELFTAHPKTLKECWLPCPNYCVRSDWSSWSDCPYSCTTNLPSFRQRTRQVVNLSPARGGWSTTCPQLTPLDFSEKEKCPAISCFSYKWYTSTWGSCVLNEIDCGDGKEERAVLCQRSDKLFVSEMYCSNVTKPSSSQRCSVNCLQDCIVSTWGKWSNCSHTCGDSIEKRHRTIVTSSLSFGRLCPSLTEKRLCHEIPCSLFKWSAQLWSTCKLSTNSTCGNGTQTRKVICLPDPVRESVCMKQAPKSSTTQSCELPCPGDCVLSNWGSWSTCVKGRNGCIRSRVRNIVRKASLTSPKKCHFNESTMEEQRESCDCPSAGKLVLTEWSTCQLNHTSGPNCGKGQQFRSVKCKGEKGQILSDEYCTGKNMSVMVQNCRVKCPVDCILGKWRPWSLCSKTCGADGVVMRSRKIIVVGMYGGRKCPDKSSLKQKRPCNVKPCYTYTLKKGKWSKCYVDGQGCGYGTQTKETWCKRSDGKLVNLYYCFEHLKRSADTKDLNVLQAVLNTISTLSVSTKQKCEVTCPGDCFSHEWSEWSICGRSCFSNANQSTFHTRSRIIIAKPVTAGKACATDLQQTQTCQPDENTKCIEVKWKTGPWQKNGTRKVWCEASNGLSVSEACGLNKPSTTKLCETKCSDPNAVCSDGKCICQALFESFQSQCIPINGCLHNGHCIFKNTICKKQECECREGHERNTTIEPCVWVQGPSTTSKATILSSKPSVASTVLNSKPSGLNSKPSVASTILNSKHTGLNSKPTLISTKLNSEPTLTSNTSDEDNKKSLEGDGTIPLGYWKWIGIGGGALLFMILLAVGVLCYMRRQNKTKKKYKEKSPNAIELIGMISIPDADNGKPAKV